MFSEPYLFSVYLIAFILGAVVTTLNIIIYKKQKTAESHIFVTLSLVLLLYLIFELYLNYHIRSGSFNTSLRIFMFLTDFFYYLFVYAWIKLLFLLSDKIFYKWKYTIIISIYGAVAETIGWVYCRFQPEDYFIQVSPGFWQKILLLMNFCFGIWLLYLSISFLVFGIHFLEKSSNRKGVIAFSGILMFYMLWIMAWDFRLVSGREFDTTSFSTFDPMIVIYITYSISVVWIFYKKDPLEIIHESEDAADKTTRISEEKIDSRHLQMIAENYHLTEREIQVLELVNQGLSNPDIGKKLFIAENTVKRHLNNIYNKTGAKGRYELLSFIYNSNNKKTSLPI